MAKKRKGGKAPSKPSRPVKSPSKRHTYPTKYASVSQGGKKRRLIHKPAVFQSPKYFGGFGLGYLNFLDTVENRLVRERAELAELRRQIDIERREIEAAARAVEVERVRIEALIASGSIIPQGYRSDVRTPAEMVQDAFDKGITDPEALTAGGDEYYKLIAEISDLSPHEIYSMFKSPDKFGIEA